jgi:phosphorylcholine metabolism protein LicD
MDYQHTQLPTSAEKLAHLSELLLSHCAKYNIIIWPEYGSLLGYKRYNSVVPWDHTGNFGIYMNDKNKLIVTFNQEYNNKYFL